MNEPFPSHGGSAKMYFVGTSSENVGVRTASLQKPMASLREPAFDLGGRLRLKHRELFFAGGIKKLETRNAAFDAVKKFPLDGRSARRDPGIGGMDFVAFPADQVPEKREASPPEGAVKLFIREPVNLDQNKAGRSFRPFRFGKTKKPDGPIRPAEAPFDLFEIKT